jgi:hypothetical protein
MYLFLFMILRLLFLLFIILSVEKYSLKFSGICDCFQYKRASCERNHVYCVVIVDQ